MAKTVGILLILFLAAAGFSEYYEAGDGGASFATDLSVKKCKEPNISAVFICSGNVVKVISNNFDEGITFYKPDGKIVYCPEAAPAEMGAECVQLLSPNLCSPNSVCPQKDGSNAISKPDQQQVNRPPAGSQDSKPASSTPEPPAESTISEPENITLGSDIYVYAIIIAGMIVIAVLNYVYFKTRGTGTS